VRYFINQHGEIIVVDEHKSYANRVLHMSLRKVLLTHVRVKIYRDNFCLDTRQCALTSSQKRTAQKLYRESRCSAYTNLISDKFYQSSNFDHSPRIIWQ
jgi:hypothetical protein